MHGLRPPSPAYPRSEAQWRQHHRLCVQPALSQRKDPPVLDATDPSTDPANARYYHDVFVTVGGIETAILAGTVSHGLTGDDRFKVQIPHGVPTPQADVKALNFRGVETNAKSLDVA